MGISLGMESLSGMTKSLSDCCVSLAWLEEEVRILGILMNLPFG